MQNYRELKVWVKAHAVALMTYRLTADFPTDERFGIISQMRRAATSIPANIAEGTGRSSNPDFARFLHHSMGSARELEYFGLLSRDLGYLDAAGHAQFAEEIEELRRMLSGLISRVSAN
jgi:four helix bundle protein